jgi:hypothetical protein
VLLAAAGTATSLSGRAAKRCLLGGAVRCWGRTALWTPVQSMRRSVEEGCWDCMRVECLAGTSEGMFYIRLRPSTAIGCGTKRGAAGLM